MNRTQKIGSQDTTQKVAKRKKFEWTSDLDPPEGLFSDVGGGGRGCGPVSGAPPAPPAPPPPPPPAAAGPSLPPPAPPSAPATADCLVGSQFGLCAEQPTCPRRKKNKK